MTTPADDPGTDIDLDLLEPFLRQLVDLVGVASTMAIVDACGGTCLFIAREPGEDALLTRIVGPEKAAIIGRAIGPDRRLVPKAGPALREVRDRLIRADLAHMSVRQVARKYRLGERWVWAIQAAGDGAADRRQRGLFD